MLFSTFSLLALVTTSLYLLWKALKPTRKLKNVPVLGYDGSKASLEAAKKRFITNAGDILIEGYQQVRLSSHIRSVTTKFGFRLVMASSTRLPLIAKDSLFPPNIPKNSRMRQRTRWTF
jgi:hypothetical protein